MCFVSPPLVVSSIWPRNRFEGSVKHIGIYATYDDDVTYRQKQIPMESSCSARSTLLFDNKHWNIRVRLTHNLIGITSHLPAILCFPSNALSPRLPFMQICSLYIQVVQYTVFPLLLCSHPLSGEGIIRQYQISTNLI